MLPSTCASTLAAPRGCSTGYASGTFRARGACKASLPALCR